MSEEKQLILEVNKNKDKLDKMCLEHNPILWMEEENRKDKTMFSQQKPML